MNLRRPLETDLGLVHAIWTHPLVRMYLGGPAKLESVDRVFRQILAVDPTRESYWIAVDSESKSPFGLISVGPYHEPGALEVSYQFLPDYWGRGLASTAISDAIERCRLEFGYSRLLAETQLANECSCRLLEKMDFKPIRKLERFNAEQVVYCREWE